MNFFKNSSSHGDAVSIGAFKHVLRDSFIVFGSYVLQQKTLPLILNFYFKPTIDNSVVYGCEFFEYTADSSLKCNTLDFNE